TAWPARCHRPPARGQPAPEWAPPAHGVAVPCGCPIQHPVSLTTSSCSALHNLRGLWDNQRECGPAFRTIHDRCLATVSAGDALHNCQTEPRAAPLCCEERLEQAIDDWRGNARPAIGDFDFQTPRGVACREPTTT